MNKLPEYRVNLVRTLRASQTESEERLWEHLRGRRLAGLKFRRQRPIGRYVADFCCDEQRLIVEIDGAVHDQPEQRAYDAVSSEWLAASGYTMVHVTPDQVMHDLEAALTAIKTTARPYPRPPSSGSSFATFSPPQEKDFLPSPE